MNLGITLLAVAVGYLLGSVSFSRLGVRFFAPDGDLAELAIQVAGTEEEHGVSTFGANSASMILGPRLGCLVGLLDMLKVALPVLAFRLAHPEPAHAVVTAVAGLVGHNWPVYYGFKGGRGFSVILGSFFVLDWLGALVSLAGGLLLGTVIFASTAVADLAWLVLMILWMWLRHQDAWFLVFAVLANLLFLLAMVPDIRTILKYHRKGKLDAYLQGLQLSSPRSRGMNRMTDSVKRVRSKVFRALLIALCALLIIALIGPFLVPIPPLEGTVPPAQLADPDSRFIEVNGLKVHYKTAGAGEPTVILLHGFGASVFSWREVMEPLGEWGSVIAFDRPAFGLTERPLSWEQGANPYTPDAQVALLLGLMDTLAVDEAILVGNSAGGTVTANAALTHPERFDALVFVDAAIYQGGGAPSWVRPLLRTPQADRLGPLLARQIQTRGDAFINSAWHDPDKITPEIRSGYRRPLRAEHWDRALWELTQASGQSGLSARVDELSMPVLVITGDDDRIVPTEQSVRLAQELPQAELVVIPNCGHVPHEECPEPFLSAVEAFLRDLPEK